jgi:hypothetical protein
MYWSDKKIVCSLRDVMIFGYVLLVLSICSVILQGMQKVLAITFSFMTEIDPRSVLVWEPIPICMYAHPQLH